MANWCDTTYVFEGTRKDIFRFQNSLKKYTSSQFTNRVGTRPAWEGNIAFGFGFDPETIPCRGIIETIYEIQKGEDFDWFCIACSDAWGPNYEIFDAIINKCFPNVTYEMMAEEPGGEVFINTDTEGKYFPYRYRIVIYSNDFIEKRFQNFQEINEFLSSITSDPIKLESVDQVEEYLNNDENFNKKFEGGHIFEYDSKI